MSNQTPIHDDLDDIQVFAKQKKIYPKSVDGFYRQLKWIIMSVCLVIYYLAPFLRWNREGMVPDQAILIDLPARRLYFFMIEIWPQEVYYLVGILVLAAFGLFFVTALLGRVWCGYFCFQTVWTDLFILVERIFQGDRVARQRLDSAPWSFNKLWRKAATHICWVLIGMCTAGAFVFYFNDAFQLWNDIVNLSVSKTVLGFVAGLTFMTYLMAGFAREQVCTFMCPYSRFQSGMLDVDSLVIAYDHKRGEPRGKVHKGESWDSRGHCVDCSACVQVCPMGIDIRNGLQIECIACGLCIDACNNIMDKLNLPRGLVRYDSERNRIAREQGKPEEWHILRPRTIIYTLLLCVVGGIMLYGLLNRSTEELHVLHDRAPLFVQLSDGTIRNAYTIKILNKTAQIQNFSIDVIGIDEQKIEITNPLPVDASRISVEPDKVGKFRMFIESMPIDAVVSKDISILLKNNDTNEIVKVKSDFFFANQN